MAAEGSEQTDTSAEPDGTPRTRPRYWVLQVLVRAVPVVVVMQVSFEVLLRNNWFVTDSPYTPGPVAALLAFGPAGIWAVVDGYRYVPAALLALLGAGLYRYRTSRTSS